MHKRTSPATKTIRAHVCSATNPMAFPRKLKIAPTILPTTVGNTSVTFPASLLSASANLSIFSALPPSFGGETSVLSPPPKSPMTECTIVAIPAKRAESVQIMTTNCSRIKIRILYGKGMFLSRTFSRVCLILANCVCRSFQFCDSISNLACFLVFKSSSLCLYNCLCSSV